MARHFGIWSLVTVIILAGLGQRVAGFTDRGHRVNGEDTGRPAIVVSVFDQVGVSPEILTNAKNHVTRIYGDVGVDVLWTDQTAKDAAGRFVIRLMIRRIGSRPRMMGNALGDSRGTEGTAFVYRDRVLDVARARNLDVGTLLAYAMAHEMGHLLLPYPSHAVTGIMHIDWDGADFAQMSGGTLRFTAAEASSIRTRASNLGTTGTADGDSRRRTPEITGGYTADTMPPIDEFTGDAM
jgi:hypothetical protein